MVKVYKPTSEFKVLCTLVSGGKPFNELKRETGLSSRWLSKTLVELLKGGFIQKSGSLYQLASMENVREMVRRELIELNKSAAALLPSIDLYEKALRAANFIGQDKNVIGVVLFGSVMRGVATSESDIDLLVISIEKPDLTDTIYDAMVEVEASIEALTTTVRQFLLNLLDEPIIVFGVIEGYEVLYDRFNMVRGLLKWKEMEIKRRWFYDAEEGIWLEKRLQPYLKRHATSY